MTFTFSYPTLTSCKKGFSPNTASIGFHKSIGLPWSADAEIKVNLSFTPSFPVTPVLHGKGVVTYKAVICLPYHIFMFTVVNIGFNSGLLFN